MSTSRDPGPDAPSPARHSVFGRVEDPGGKVVPAEIFWVDAEHAGDEAVALFDAHKVATADTKGEFWAADLPAGPCLLVPDVHRLHVSDDEFRIAHGTHVTLPTDDPVALRFPRNRVEYGSIHGVVRDQIDRRPGSRLRVRLFDPLGNLVRDERTHTDGTFHFPMLLTPALYTLVLDGSRRNLGGEFPAELERNKRLDVTIDQHRHPPGPRAGVRVAVTNWLGTLVGGAHVEVDVPGFTIPPAKTNSHGIAEVGDLPARPTLVKAGAPGHWPAAAKLAADAPDGDVEVPIQLERSVRLRVRIVDEATGRPVHHANLSVAGDGVDAVAWGGLSIRPGQAPPDHRDLPVRAGTLTVRAESPGYARAEEVVTVPGDAPDEVSVTLSLRPRS